MFCILLHYRVNIHIFPFFFSLFYPLVTLMLKYCFSGSFHHSYFFLLFSHPLNFTKEYTLAVLGLVLHFSLLCCFNPFLQLLTSLFRKAFCFLCCLLWYFCLWVHFKLLNENKPVIWMGKWVLWKKDLYPTQQSGTFLWFFLFVYFKGPIKADFCHLSNFTCIVVHLVKVTPESMCVPVWNAPTTNL